MHTTVKSAVSASHRDSLADVRPAMAKADLRPQVSASVLPELVDVAIKKGHLKNLAAAEVLDLSESQLGRLVKDGDLKLKHLEGLGPTTLAEFGRQLLAQYEPLSTPHARFLHLLREQRRITDELEQLAEHVA